jgi:hypothetical protein
MKNSLLKFTLLFSLALVSVFSANAAVVVSGSAGAADGSYTTVKQAFDALNAVAVSQSGRTISIAISANTTETASAVLSAANDDWTALNIYPSSTNITISSAAGLSAPMIDLNGVNNVTIWGSNGGSGSSQDLTINNQSTNSSACAVRFVDGASNCTVKYCILKSSGLQNYGAGGIVQIRNVAGSVGNSNITISNNQITSSTGGRSASGIYGLGAATKINTNVTISNNTIYDFMFSQYGSNGIRVGDYNTGWTISGNTIYETTSYATDPVYNGVFYGIQVSSRNAYGEPSASTGTYDITITGNYIGGAAADHSGTFTKTNAGLNRFYGIAIFPNTGGTVSSVQGNTINNISWAEKNSQTISGTNQFVAIYAGGDGNINIGTSTPNTIGATTGTGGITLTGGSGASSSGERFVGFLLEGTGTISCENNTIGSVTIANSTATTATHFYGIMKANGGTTSISNNYIGSASTASSINASSASTGAAQVVYGIYNTGTGNLTVSGNTIKNLNNNCATSSTNLGTICGVYNSGGTGTNTVNKNFITNFTTAAPGAPAANNSNKLYGIQIAGGTTTYSNNVISLGDATPTMVYGLYQTSGSGTNSILYNTLNVTGTPLTGTTIASYALYSTGTSNTRIFRNNICANTRSNGGTASGSHYAIYVAATGGTYFIDFNDYYAPNTGGVLGYYAADKATLAAFQATSGQDLSSVNTDPTFAAYTGTASELKPQSATTLFANYNANVLTDYAGTTRSVTVPSIGAFEGLVAPTAPASNIDLVVSSVVRARYTTLKAAFDAINCGSFSTSDDITLRITGNTTETAAAVLNPKSTNYSSVTIYPTTTGLSISGSLATPLIDLNGSSSVTIDGRLYNSDGSALVSGNAQNLTITNTSTSSTSGTCAIRVYNNTTTPADYATTIKYCILKGSTTSSTSGVVMFTSTASASSYMTGVTLSGNKITCSADANRPLNAIYSSGNSSSKYNRITISNNRIYDFLSRGTDSNGINLAGFNYTCSITGNSLYEAASFVPTATRTYNLITISSVDSKDISITNNYLGGSAAYCVGTWTKTKGASNYTSYFTGLNITVGPTISTTTTVDNNYIKGFDWTDGGASSWTAITTASSTGDVNIGKVSGNYIGSTGVSPYSIIVTAGNTNANMYGIYIGSTGTTNCENNYIYGFKVDNTGTNKATNLYAIIKSNTAGTTTIKGNTIGDPNTSASIYNAAAADPNWPTNQTTCGIKNLGTGTISIDYNTITNMSVASTKTGNGQYEEVSTYGVFSVAGTNSITNNTISNIITACSYNNGFYQLQNACIGIGLFSTTAVANTISGNVVHSLSNTNSSFGGCIVGIAYNGGTTASAIKNNFIYNLSVHASSTSGYLHGIFANAGVATYSNNVISLGGDTKTAIYGIYDTGAASQTCSIFYNTIYLSGTVGSGATNKSACLWNNAASNTRDYRNNIFHNTRTTTSGSNLHYTLYCVASTGTLNCNYNDYKITAAAGQTLGYFAANVTALPIVTGKTGNDANSLTTDPGYTPSTTPISFKPTSLTLNGTDLSGLSLTKDFNQNMRSTTAPCMGAWETETNKWVGGTSTDFELAANWSGGIVPAADEAIAFHDNPDRDCYLTANRSITDLTINQSTDKLYTNGYTLTIKGDLNLSNNAKIDASAASSTVVLNKQTPLTLPASCFVNDQVYNLTINSPYNVKYNGNITLLNTLTATSSKLDVFTNSPTFTYGGSSAQTINTGLFPGDSIKNLVIDNAAGVSLGTDFIVNTSLTINSGKILTIPVTKKLVVTGTITNNAGVSGLVVKADPAGALANGTLIFYNPVGSPVTGTVELYTKSVLPRKQYIGIPLRSTTYSGSFSSKSIYAWSENVTGTSGMWTSYSGATSMTSFVGYALGSSAAGVITFQGTLENGNFSSGQLSYSPAATWVGTHFLANPYTAALDITAISFGSSSTSVIENTVYVFNTGSIDDWEAGGSGLTFGSAPGQYTSVPIFVAGLNGLPSQIPSMGGFLVKVKSNNAAATVAWNYNSAFLTKNTELLKSKRAPLISTRLNVKGSKNSFDCMWMITSSKCSHNFDNGWDGEKSLAGAGTLQLFATEKDGKNYQVSSVDNVNDTYLSFQASKNDTSYTMMFNHENLSDAYSTLYLVDLDLNKTIDISETGTTYRFVSKQTASPTKRFKIVTNFEESGIATQVDEISTELLLNNNGNKIEVVNKFDCEGALYIYNVSGEFIKKFRIMPDSKSLHEPELPTGAYIAKVHLVNGKTISQKVLLQ